ncbi:MAG: hypothetical protein H0U49_07510 [Parachlamydiaceae bacterium]|nr:hypothetical protein [Parachlamydiaceae bacterium]
MDKTPIETTNPQWQHVVDYAREHLPLEGKLLVNSKGFGYLTVDDGYVQQLFPMLGLKEQGYRPPPYYRRSGSPGAHISVFYVNEYISPTEVGQTFHFELKQISIVKTRNAKFVVLQVQSPELEKLREKYGLTPKLLGHDFHISLGKKEYHHNRQ